MLPPPPHLVQPPTFADMAGRCVLYIAGFDMVSWTDALPHIGQDALVVDTTEALPRDPADNKGKSKGKGKRGRGFERTVDSVTKQRGFPDAVASVLEAARQSRKVVVQCRKGVHRSPVVGAAAREVLIGEGFSVVICELSCCQRDLIAEMVGVCEDWQKGLRGSADCPASYNNFRLADLVKDEDGLNNLDTIGIGRVAPGAMRGSAVPIARHSPYGQASQPSSLPPAPLPSAQPAFVAFVPAPLPMPTAPPAARVAEGPSSAAVAFVPAPLPMPPAPPAEGPSSAATHEWAEDIAWYIDHYELDEAAQSAMRDLANINTSEVGKALRKLTSKAERGDDVRNPSAFVAIACRNAMMRSRTRK